MSEEGFSIEDAQRERYAAPIRVAALAMLSALILCHNAASATEADPQTRFDAIKQFVDAAMVIAKEAGIK